MSDSGVIKTRASRCFKSLADPSPASRRFVRMIFGVLSYSGSSGFCFKENSLSCDCLCLPISPNFRVVFGPVSAVL